jgi:hypothetical protein
MSRTFAVTLSSNITDMLSEENKFIKGIGMIWPNDDIKDQMKQSGNLTFSKRVSYLFNRKKRDIARMQAILQLSEKERFAK